MTRPGISAVAAREVAWVRGEPAMLILLLVVPVLAFVLLSATFSNAVIRDLRVDVVDADGSPTAQEFIQLIDAAPGIAVDRRSPDLSGAMRAVRSGDAIAAVYIPQNLERDLLAGRRPQIVTFYNRQFLTPGNIAASGLQSALTAAVTDLPRAAGAGHRAKGSILVERYVLSNPALNYAQFLLRALLPTVVHVVAAIAGAVAIGSEFGRKRGFDRWMAAAGGSPLAALVGKLAPYLGLLIVLMAVASVILHGVFGVPFRGDALLTVVGAFVFVAGYLAIGAFLVLLARNLAFGLSLVGIVCSPAFGFAGVGFPILGMSGFPKVWSALLPLRWYLRLLFDQAAFGAPPRQSIPSLLALAALALAFGALACWRLRAVAAAPPARPVPVAEPPRGPGIGGAFVFEWRRVLGDSGAFALIVIAPLIYGIFYPQPYLGQLIRDVPIAVVDDDRTEFSRQFVQALDVHESLVVAERPATLAEAEAAVAARRVYGVVGIPAGTEREILRGQPARIPAYVDATYFLLNSRVTQGINEAAAALQAETASGPARPDGAAARAAFAQSAPVELLSQPLYNPTGAYASYVVPAAFVLILQQTLIMGVATLGGVAREAGGAAARRTRGAPVAIAGQTLAHLALALPAWALYLIVLPRFYGFAASRDLFALVAIAVPFILAASLIGQIFGGFFRRRETAVALLLAFGLPLFFLAGVAWPPEAIPPVIRALAQAIPSSAGINAVLHVNQAGASLGEVRSDWLHLWLLVAVYAALALAIPRLRRTEDAHA